jgi:hypothetical protein
MDPFETLPTTRRNPDRLPPHSIEAEKGVIGCLLDSPEASLAYCFTKFNCSGEQFYDVKHKSIYGTLTEMSAKKAPINLVTVGQYLKDRNRLDDSGGFAYLSELMSSLPSSGLLSYYSDIVLEKYQLRQALTLCADQIDKIHNYQGNPSELIATFKERAFNLKVVSTKLPAIETLSESFKDVEPEPPILVDEIVHQYDKILFSGPAKAHKSWSMIDMGISISVGAPFWGKPTTQGKVLYINLELPRWACQKRVAEIAVAKNVKLRGDQFEMWHLRGTMATAETILSEILHKKYALIIIDPIYKLLHGRDENAASDMGGLLMLLDSIAKSTGAAIAFASHFAKGDQSKKNAIDRTSGSGVFARDPDVIMTMTPLEEHNMFVIETAFRTMAPMPPFAIEWQYPLYQPADNVDTDQIQSPGKKKGRDKSATDDQILQLIPEHSGLSDQEWFDAALSTHSISKKTFNRRRDSLKSKRLVYLSPSTDLWTRRIN